MARRHDGGGLRRLFQSQILAGCIFFVMAVVFAGWTWDVVDTDSKLAGAPVATAEIVDVHDPGGRGTSWVVVEFATRSGERVRAEVEDWYWQPKPRVGDQGRVRYDPAEPESYVRDARWDPSVFDVLVPGGLAGLFLVGALLGWTRRLPRWIMER